MLKAKGPANYAQASRTQPQRIRETLPPAVHYNNTHSREHDNSIRPVVLDLTEHETDLG